MPKRDFNKVAKVAKVAEVAPRHGYSPVNLLYIFRTPFLKNTSGRLLLYLKFYYYYHQNFSYLSECKTFREILQNYQLNQQ